MPLPPETPRVPKVRVPVELFCKETPSVPPVTLVLPKLMSAVVVPMRMPCVVEPETEVEPKENELPPAPSESATPERLMPCPLLAVVVTLANPPATESVPVVRLSACPLPFKVTSGEALLPTVSVPKVLPEILAPVVEPTVKPRSRLP